MLCLHAAAAPPISGLQSAARARRRGRSVSSAARVRAAGAAQEADAAAAPPPPYTTLSVPVFSMSTAEVRAAVITLRAACHSPHTPDALTPAGHARRARHDEYYHVRRADHHSAAGARRRLWRATADCAALTRAPLHTRQRRYSVALYHGTQTLENMRATGRGVMQILGAQHAALVPLLGKTRGQDVDKARA